VIGLLRGTALHSSLCALLFWGWICGGGGFLLHRGKCFSVQSSWVFSNTKKLKALLCWVFPKRWKKKIFTLKCQEEKW